MNARELIRECVNAITFIICMFFIFSYDVILEWLF